ncbi:MAG: TFIIB-type zinc finger domain-containing protein [Methanobacteriaceae archaeon]
MKELVCENCGSKSFVEENGITTCKSCGTKYPEFSLDKVGIEEELKNKEIRRLVEVNKKGLKFRKIRIILIIIMGFLSVIVILNVLPDKWAPNGSGGYYKAPASGLGGGLEEAIVFFMILILFLVIGYFLNRYGFFHNGQSDLEPSLNILSDDEVLKYAPKSKAARRIKAKRK